MTLELRDDLPRNVKLAIAWRACSQLILRHPGRDFRVVETHPCDGGYDCLSVRRGPEMELVATFNLAGSGMLLGPPLGRVPADHVAEPNTDRYPVLGLAPSRTELVEEIERVVGLAAPVVEKRPLGATGVTLLAVQELLERGAMGARGLDVRNGWFDSSGFGAPVGVRTWARGLPGANTAEDVPWQVRMRAAGRYWAIDREAMAETPRVTVCLATSRVWTGGTTDKALIGEYRRGAGIRELAWWLEQELDR